MPAMTVPFDLVMKDCNIFAFERAVVDPFLLSNCCGAVETFPGLADCRPTILDCLRHDPVFQPCNEGCLVFRALLCFANGIAALVPICPLFDPMPWDLSHLSIFSFVEKVPVYPIVKAVYLRHWDCSI